MYSGIGYESANLTVAQRRQVNLVGTRSALAGRFSWGLMYHCAQYGFVSIEIWFAAVSTVKVSILLFYMEILLFENKARCMAQTIITLSGLLCFLGILLSVFLCTPEHESWSTFVDGHCRGSAPKGELAFGLLNILLDLVVLVLPLRVIWQLRMDIKRKIGLTAVFSCGVLCVSRQIPLNECLLD